jgi:hypothetical protein
MQAAQLYRAEGLDPLVAISDEGELLAVLDEIMVGWRIAPIPMMGQGSGAAITIEQGATGWTCAGEVYDEPLTYRDPVSTACSLIANLYKAQTLIDREGLVFHSAGVRIGAGLVLLTGYYRAGKSLFSAACAAAGLQVFSDDIIPLDPAGRTARAPGLAIRLRLPLPSGLAPEIRDFITAHNIAQNPRYAYVCPSVELLAPRDTVAPVSGIVTLSRKEGARARLWRMPPADALGEAIRRNFAREKPAVGILEALEGLVDAVPCLRMTYDEPGEAVELLRDVFEGRLTEFVPEAPQYIPTDPDSESSGRVAVPLDAASVIRRRPGAHFRQRDGEVFLTDAAEQIIFHLNPTGSAVWRLIEQPVPFGEIADLFVTGFPDRDPAALTADLSDLVRRLAQSGLVEILGAEVDG